MISVQFLVSKSRDNWKEKALAEFLFLSFSFLFQLFVTLFKDVKDEGALAWPVAFRWSKSLFRDGNSLWQVVQLINMSLIVCASAGTLTDFLVSLAFFPLGLETLLASVLGSLHSSTVSVTPFSWRLSSNSLALFSCRLVSYRSTFTPSPVPFSLKLSS